MRFLGARQASSEVELLLNAKADKDRVLQKWEWCGLEGRCAEDLGHRARKLLQVFSLETGVYRDALASFRRKVPLQLSPGAALLNTPGHELSTLPGHLQRTCRTWAMVRQWCGSG